LVAPTTLIKSKRTAISKKINETKLKIKETLDDDKIKKLKEILIKLNSKLKKDDKKF
jgi:hypothetical protein